MIAVEIREPGGPDVLVAVDGPHLLAGGDAPKPDRLVVAGGGQRLAVAGEADAGDAHLVADQLLQLLARLDVPQPDGLVLAAGGERLAVGRHRQRLDVAGVPL